MADDDHMNVRTNASMYTRGGGDSKGSGGSGGSCVLDNCIEACPVTPVGGILKKDPFLLHFFLRFKALSFATRSKRPIDTKFKCSNILIPPFP